MATLILLALAILLPPFKGVSSQERTVCRQRNIPGNLDLCLAEIRTRALDTCNSPYGEAYFTRCPPQNRFSINCFQYNTVTEPRSRAQLALGVQSPDLSNIDRFLGIEYVSPAGSYTGCDHTYNYPNEKRFFVDPLSDHAYPSWDLREQPTYHWDYNDGELFTLISRAVNDGRPEHVVVNIQGNDVANGLHLSVYNGHKNFHNSPSPAAFMLYRQTRRLFVERIPSVFNVTDFAERHQLQGPIAFSWVNALYDAYAISLFEHGQNCASLVQDALQVVLPRVDFLPNEVDLSVFLRVRRTSGAFPYNCGMPRDYYVDPIHPTAVTTTTSDIRPGALTTYTMIMNKVNPQPSDFDGKLHTLMLMSSTTGSLHGMIVNVEGDNMTSQFGRVSSGFVAVPYTVPQVSPDGQYHFFHVLAYEQGVRIPTSLDFSRYIRRAVLVRLPRDSFTDMAGFLSDFQLTLVGVSRMVLLDDDEYSQCRRL